MDPELFSLLFGAFMLGWFASLFCWHLVFWFYMRCKKGRD